MKIHIEIEVDVGYDFQPAEEATSDYPGCSAELMVNSVTLDSLEISDHLTKAVKEQIGDAVFGELTA